MAARDISVPTLWAVIGGCEQIALTNTLHIAQQTFDI